VSSQAEYLALTGTAGLLDRSGRGRLRLTGGDRRAYLQGILTNDIAALASGTGCYAAMLTAQGRMISDMRVLELGDAILLDLPSHTAAPIRDRLEQFIFSEDVAVADMTASLRQVGVYGPQASTVLAATLDRLRLAGEPAPGAAWLDQLPLNGNGRWDVRGTPAIVARTDDYGVEGFDVFVDQTAAGEFTKTLIDAGAMRVGEEAADVCRIEAGRPAFGQDMDEDTIPLEAGIEDRAISHSKGCYVGQEIIIRVLHRGHGRVARRLVGFDTDGLVAPGDRVYAGERDIGFVTSVAHSQALDRPIALGYVHRDFVAPGTNVSVAAAAGAPVAARVAALPFVRRPIGS
jgi:folate-binding protein YgfZ